MIAENNAIDIDIPDSPFGDFDFDRYLVEQEACPVVEYNDSRATNQNTDTPGDQTDGVVTGPDGTHICLVYEPMRESLRLFRRHFTDSRFPLPLLKGYLQILLMGLDYLHSECQIIQVSLILFLTL